MGVAAARVVAGVEAVVGAVAVAALVRGQQQRAHSRPGVGARKDVLLEARPTRSPKLVAAFEAVFKAAFEGRRRHEGVDAGARGLDAVCGGGSREPRVDAVASEAAREGAAKGRARRPHLGARTEWKQRKGHTLISSPSLLQKCAKARNNDVPTMSQRCKRTARVCVFVRTFGQERLLF